MKIKVWFEVTPWDVDQNGELRQDRLPTLLTTPFTWPCSGNIKRYSAIIEIPYKAEPVIELEKTEAEKIK